MHKVAMEMGKWAMEQAKAHGFDNLSSQDWDDLKDCMEIVKSAICADKDYREVEAIDDFEKEYGRMGYRGRAANGRFVHRSGRGRSAGYMPIPYLHMMDDEDYAAYDDIPYPMTGYRMGYTGGRNENSGNMSEMSRSSDSGNRRYGYDGMNMRQPSRYGETYDRYADRRRHYHDTKDADAKKQMDESMKEYMSDVMENMRDMWKDADPSLRQTMKADLTKMVQQLQ